MIDQAIAATEVVEIPVARSQLDFENGRSGIIILPVDINAEELLNVVTHLTGRMAPALLENQRVAKGQVLEIARAMPPKPVS